MEYLTLAFTGLLAALGGLFGGAEAASVVSNPTITPEIGFTERIIDDPNRGVATPASGGSSSSCTLSFSNPTVVSGTDTTVNLTVSRAGGETAQGDALHRCPRNVDISSCTRAMSDLVETFATGVSGSFTTPADATALLPGTYWYFYTGTVSMTFTQNDTHSHSYIFQCPNSVEVVGAPVVNVVANPNAVTYGGSTDLAWSVVSNPPATSCSGSWTGSALSATGGTLSSGPVTPSSLSPSNNPAIETFTVTCENAFGQGSGSVDVSVQSLPNLRVTGVSENVTSTGDPITGIYPSFDINGTILAEFNSISQDIPYRFILERVFNNNTVSTVGTVTGGLGQGSSVTRGLTYNNLPFGEYNATLEVDLPAPGNVSENPIGSETVDNTFTHNFDLIQPDPIIALTTEPRIIRAGETADITWDITIGYDINCSVFGTGINRTDIGFSSTTGALNLNGTETTPPLENETDYLLRCVTPTTGNIHTATATVKVLPSVEEPG